MVLEFCFSCNQGYLKPTGIVALEGEAARDFRDISRKKIFVCESCGQKRVKIGQNEYVEIEDNVKTRPE